MDERSNVPIELDEERTAYEEPKVTSYTEEELMLSVEAFGASMAGEW